MVLESCYFWKVYIFGKFLYLESCYFWKVSIFRNLLFLENLYFWKVYIFGNLLFLETYYFGKVFEAPCILPVEPPRGVSSMVCCFVFMYSFSMISSYSDLEDIG